MIPDNNNAEPHDSSHNDPSSPEEMHISSLSHLVQQSHSFFYEMARTSTSKETRMKLRQLATSVLEPLPSTPLVSSSAITTSTIKHDELTYATTTASLMSLCLILTSLSIQTASIEHHQQICRSAASAISSAMEEFLQTKHSNDFMTKHNPDAMILRRLVLSILLEHRRMVMHRNTVIATSAPTENVETAATNHGPVYIDLHIVTNLARLLGMDHCDCCDTATAMTNKINSHIDDADDSMLSDVVTFVINNGLQISHDGSNDGNPMIHGETHGVTNNNVGTVSVPTPEMEQIRPENFDSLTTIISFASQFRPWHRIDPIQLIHIAMDHLLWHSAEKICYSLTTGDPQFVKNPTMGIDAVSTYVDITIQRRAHRQADKIATEFFDVLAVGTNNDLLERYFLNARYLHACNTIVKLIRRGAIPVIERQVERIDQSVFKVKEHRGTISINYDVEPFYEGGTTMNTAGTDIRNFALRKLEESGHLDAALRFSTVWGMDYVMDPEVMKLAEQRRKQLYIQWEDLFPHQAAIPDLITTPDALEHAMMNELGSGHTVYGFDVEWGGDDDTGIVGAALLQIATIDNVILVDIPTLSQTATGVEALERHINTLFHNPNIKMIGFSCREDISKLMNSPCMRKERHWFQSEHVAGCSHSIIDLQGMIARLNIEQLPKDHFGLSKVCEYYLMKPLDKSEQCSEWNQRPLSMKQRIYAALDAYVCAMIYTKMMKMEQSTAATSTITSSHTM